jgi:hypothetical protein
VELADLAVPDLATLDLSTEDLASPDLSQPDLNQPDLRAPFCPADPTLLACYRFEDGAHPGQVMDESMYANHASATAATFPAGKNGSAISLASNGLVSAGDPASLTQPGPMTLEAWVKLNSLPPDPNRFGVVDDEGQWGMFVYSNGRLACSFNARLFSTDFALGTGAWQHVACTYDRQTVRAYVDGTERAMVGETGALGAGTNDGMRIGSNSPTGEVLDGLIDDLRIWSVAKSAQQICSDAGC